MLLLTDILKPQHIKLSLTATDKNGVIVELVDMLAANGDLVDRDKILAAILERENVRTTGIGNGLALPHGKSSGVDKLVMAVGRSNAGVEFQSVDGRIVKLVMLLASPLDKTGPHIQALARISRLMSVDTFRGKLMAAVSAEELYRLIEDRETQNR